MVDNTEPPVVSDAELANLTYEQLAALVNEGNPNDFYLEASAFDEAAGRLQQLRDDFLRESRLLQSYVSGEILVAVEEVTQRHTGRIDSVLEPMLHPGYALGLRHAGDALATGQQRLRDLQAQNTQQDPAAPPPPPEAGEQTRLQALQILRDIGTAYQDIGGRFGPLPETVNNNNFNVNTVTTNNPGPNNPFFAGGRYRPDTTFLKQSPEVTAGGEPPPVNAGGANVFAGAPPGGAPMLGGAFVSALGRPADSPFGTVGEADAAQLCGVTEAEPAGEAAPAAVLSAGVLSSGLVPSGVLGRPAVRTTIGDDREEREERTAEVQDEEVLAEELATLREEDRPETVSAEVPQPQNLVQAPVSTVSAPLVESAPARGGSLTVPAFDVRAGLELTAAAGEGTVDPKERGMHAPTSPGGAELSAVPGGTFPMITPMITPMAVPMAPPAAPAAPAPGAMPATGHGMGPMMPPMMMGGGMRGGGGQEGERFADVPVTPEAEVWDPLRATGAVLGRPEPEPSETPEPCAEQEIDAVRQAAIDAILGRRG